MLGLPIGMRPVNTLQYHIHDLRLNAMHDDYDDLYIITSDKIQFQAVYAVV